LQLGKIFEKLNGEELAKYHFELITLCDDKKITSDEFKDLLDKSSDCAMNKWENSKVKGYYKDGFATEHFNYLEKKLVLLDEYHKKKRMEVVHFTSLVLTLKTLKGLEVLESKKGKEKAEFLDKMFNEYCDLVDYLMEKMEK
jgi:hypothetical protein